MQAQSATNVKGIDVSHYQTVSDWNKVKAAGVQFVYVKSSEGSTYKDPMYLNHVKAAAAAGLKVGAYHFARPENNNPVGEAQNFIAQLALSPFDLMPVLDLESPTDPSKCSKATILAFVNAFVGAVQQATGRAVMMYTGNWFVNMYGGFGGAFSHMPLWIANYGNVQSPPDCDGWTQWTAWQYSESGTVAGVSGSCDLNVASSIEALMADLTPRYAVYQYAAQLKNFYDLNDAVAESAKWSHSYVKQIADGTIVAHNWKTLEQLTSYIAAPDYIKPVLQKLIGADKLDDPCGDENFYRILALMDRFGIFG